MKSWNKHIHAIKHKRVAAAREDWCFEKSREFGTNKKEEWLAIEMEFFQKEGWGDPYIILKNGLQIGPILSYEPYEHRFGFMWLGTADKRKSNLLLNADAISCVIFK